MFTRHYLPCQPPPLDLQGFLTHDIQRMPMRQTLRSNSIGRLPSRRSPVRHVPRSRSESVSALTIPCPT
jgi:hypothetical protein